MASHRTRVTSTLALVASTALALTACASESGEESSGGGDQLVVASYGGAFQDAQHTAFLDPFAEESGMKTIGIEGVSFDALLAQSQANNITWDVVSTDGGALANSIANDLLVPIDYSKIDAEGIPDELKTEYAIGSDQFSMNLVYSNEAFPDGMTPSDFFDPEIVAPRALPAIPQYVFEFALMADGVAPTDLYPLDVDRAFSVLDRIKDQVMAFKDATDIQALITQGEIDAAYTPAGRVEDAIESGADWGYTWEGGVRETDWWAVVKGSDNTDEAMEFLNFASQPEPQANLAKGIPYGPANVDAFEFIDAELAAKLPSYPANAEVSVLLDSNWWAENQIEAKSLWDAWLLT